MRSAWQSVRLLGGNSTGSPPRYHFFGISGFVASSLEVEGGVEEIYLVCARADLAPHKRRKTPTMRPECEGDSSRRALLRQSWWLGGLRPPFALCVAERPFPSPKQHGIAPEILFFLGFRDLPRRLWRLREESRKFIRCALGLIGLSHKRRKTPTVHPECEGTHRAEHCRARYTNTVSSSDAVRSCPFQC